MALTRKQRQMASRHSDFTWMVFGGISLVMFPTFLILLTLFLDGIVSASLAWSLIPVGIMGLVPCIFCWGFVFLLLWVGKGNLMFDSHSTTPIFIVTSMGTLFCGTAFLLILITTKTVDWFYSTLFIPLYILLIGGWVYTIMMPMHSVIRCLWTCFFLFYVFFFCLLD